MSLDLNGFCIIAPGGAPLFPPLTLRVAAGEVMTVMGRSGIGKSTLLDAIGGHLAHGFRCQGTLRLDGRDITHLPAEARRIGLMFQDALLFPHLSVGDNLSFGVPRAVKGQAERRALVETALAQAGLAGMYLRDPATLSGGQRARAALMRTLLSEPLALALDEPFSKLDPDLRGEMRQFTFSHIKARQIPALLVTHDPEDASAAAGPTIDLNAPAR